jgi:ComF family protein
MWKQLFSPIVMSVPLHTNRLNQRGFNQSEIIANKYATINGLGMSNHLLRVKDTPHMAKIIDRTIRKKQIKGAFRFCGDGVPQSVILVDDVVTSGATLSECTKTLKQNGVQTVLTISLAKG